MANETKNTTSFSEETKNTTSFDTPYKSGGGQTWDDMTQTWEDTPETWEDLEEITWSNETKN